MTAAEVENPFLVAALGYAARGWRVFPLAPRSKKPFKDSHGFEEATTDATKIEEWWRETPSANVGIATGGGFFVVDVDPRHDGDNSIEQLRSVGLPRTLISHTGSGGLHLFYRSTADVPGRIGMLPGVDVRAAGGYVVAPPSVHPDGGVYRWETTDEIAEAPAALVEAVVRKRPALRAVDVGGTIPEGERNDRLYRDACAMRRRGYGEAAILAALRADDRCVPPLGDAELQQIAASACRHAPEPEAVPSPPAEFFDVPPPDYSYALPPGLTVVEGREPGDDDGPRLVAVSTIEAKPVLWRWTGRLEAGEVASLEGLPGCGKSTIGTELAAAITTGRALYGDRPRPPEGVLWISHEEDRAKTLRPRLDAAGADVSRVFICDEGSIPSFPADYDWLRRQIVKLGVGLVFIDPIDSYLDFGRNGDSNRNTDVRSRLLGLSTIAHDTGASIVMVRHWRKSGGTQAVFRAAGSIAYNAVARTVISVQKDPDDEETRVVAWPKMSNAPEPGSLAFKIGDGRRVVWLGDDHRSAQEMMDALDRHDSDKSSALREAVDWMRQYLADRGTVKSTDMQREGLVAGHSSKTMERARKALKVFSRKVGAEWWSELPSTNTANP